MIWGTFSSKAHLKRQLFKYLVAPLDSLEPAHWLGITVLDLPVHLWKLKTLETSCSQFHQR